MADPSRGGTQAHCRSALTIPQSHSVHYPMTDLEAKSPRNIKTESSFAWFNPYAPQKIREHIGGSQAALAIAVYTALVVLSCFNKCPTLDVTISVIASHAGLRYRKTQELLWMLENIGMIAIQ